MTTTHTPTPTPELTGHFAAARDAVSLLYRLHQEDHGGVATPTFFDATCDAYQAIRAAFREREAAVARRSPEGAEPTANAAAESDMAERALAWLTSRDTIRDVPLRDSLNEALQTRFGSWPMQVYALAVALRSASPTREPTP